MGRRVPSRSLYCLVYSVVLLDSAEMHVDTESCIDGTGIRCPSIGRNLWDAKHAVAQISDKKLSVVAVALADVVGDNRLGSTGEGEERIHVAQLGGIALAKMALLLADEAPCLIHLDTSDLEVAHCAVVQRGATHTDASAEPHDGVTVNAGQALDGTD